MKKVLIIGPAYYRAQLATILPGTEYFVQGSLGVDRSARTRLDREIGLPTESVPAVDYTSDLRGFDLVVLVSNHFPAYQVARIRNLADGNLVVYDENNRNSSLAGLVRENIQSREGSQTQAAVGG